MKVSKCPICNSDSYKIIHRSMRSKIKIDAYLPDCMEDMEVLKCNNCGHVWLGNFMEDSESFFEKSGLRDFAPPTIAEIRLDMEEEHDRYFENTKSIIRNKSLCDFGCGSGGYLNRAKRITSGFAGIEMEKVMRESLVEEWGPGHCFRSLKEMQKVDVFTMFHVLDHLPNPYEYIEEMKKHLNDDGKIYIETPNADDALISLYDCKSFSDFTYYVCHFMYYTNESLRILAEKSGFKVVYIKQIQRYPLANHLYWLSNGMPNGHEKWSHFREADLERAYAQLLSQMSASDTITALLSL